jgi:hypothetical protein
MNSNKPLRSSASGLISKLGNSVVGWIEGFDRLRLRGTLRSLYQPNVFEAYLCAQHVLFRNFATWANSISARLRKTSFDIAEGAGRPVQYVNSPSRSKEDIAREVAARDRVEQGLIMLITSVEPCMSYGLHRARQGPGFEFRLELRKCLHFYFYLQHPRFGFMNVRVQSWAPFRLDICLNGRHWLANQLDDAQIAYRKKENALVWIEDFPAAQKLADDQLRLDWRKELNALCEQVHPLAKEICLPLGLSYYWTISESEYATDLLFRSPDELARNYPSLVDHAMKNFSSPDVMRFLGRNVPSATGRVRGNFEGEIVSDLKHRPEGIRVKHSLNGNSIKCYDKQGSVLRVETTINHPAEFKVYRKAENHPEQPPQWRELRRGTADIPRRAEVCRAANKRYLDALAQAHDAIPLSEWTKRLCQPVTRNGKRYRAIHPFSPEDASLLQAVSHGEFALNGFRNRDLRRLLLPASLNKSKADQRKAAARISRRISILRAHRLVAKVSHTHRYQLTEKGRAIITALLAAHRADTEKLTALAA